MFDYETHVCTCRMQLILFSVKVYSAFGCFVPDEKVERKTIHYFHPKLVLHRWNLSDHIVIFHYTPLSAIKVQFNSTSAYTCVIIDSFYIPRWFWPGVQNFLLRNYNYLCNLKRPIISKEYNANKKCIHIFELLYPFRKMSK